MSANKTLENQDGGPRSLAVGGGSVHSMGCKKITGNPFVDALLDAAANTDSNGYHGNMDVSEELRKPTSQWPKK